MAKKKKTKADKVRTSTGKGDSGTLDVFIVGGEQDISKSFIDLGVSSSISGSMVTFLAGDVKLEKVPFAIDSWVLVPESSTRAGACIFIRSRNTAGLGYELVPNKKAQREIEKHRKESTEEENKEKDTLLAAIQVEKDLVEEFLDSPHPIKSFTKIFQMVIADKEGVGNGYLEVKREPLTAQGKVEGTPMELNRVFGHAIRRKVGGGFLEQISPDQFIHYKEWGDETVIERNTGKPFKVGNGNIPAQGRATELIPFIVDTLRRTNYGIPRHISTGPTIAGNRFASERNAVFFENDATPRMAIVVQGSYNLSKESRDDIKEFIEAKGKGVGAAGRVMIIQAGKKEGALTESEDVKIHFEKLTVGLAEEASFLKYQDRGDREIAEAFNLHPVFFEKDATRASANIGRSITRDQIFEPDIIDHEYTLNQTIIKAFGVKLIELRLKRPQIIDEEGQASIFQKLHRIGGITPNDIRDFLRKPRFKENWGDQPLALAMQQLKVPESRSGGKLVGDVLNMGKDMKDNADNSNDKNVNIEIQEAVEKSMSHFDLVKSLINLNNMIEATIEKKFMESKKGRRR